MIRVKIYMMDTEDKKYNIASNTYKNYNVTGKVVKLFIVYIYMYLN